MARRLSELETLQVCIAQGGIIPCKRCRVAFTQADIDGKNVENEHLHEKELGGPDEPGNRAFSHKDCHKVITHGNGATFAGSSRHKAAKANDPNRKDKFVVDRKPLALPVTIEPGTKCRRCGEMAEDCICPPPAPKRRSFGQVRR